MLFLFLISYLPVNMALADCTSPAGTAGRLEWVPAQSKVLWCDGTQWKDPSNGTISSCAGEVAGKIHYESGSLRYCDGSNWISMKGASDGSCAGTAAGHFAYSSGKMRFCDGTTWFLMTAQPACGGVSIGGYCWYYGAGAAGCDTICASHGGCNISGTRDFAGSGGTLANCNLVLDGWLAPGSTVDATDGGWGFGCTRTMGQRRRYINHGTTCSATAGFVERACACNN